MPWTGEITDAHHAPAQRRLHPRADLAARAGAGAEIGFAPDPADDRSYAAAFVGEGQRIYLKKTEELSIVLSPTCNPRRIEAATEASGIEVNQALYHNSSLAGFGYPSFKVNARFAASSRTRLRRRPPPGSTGA